jgi:hypothetical protein
MMPVRSAGAVPSTIVAMMRGDRKARGASRRMCRSPWAYVLSLHQQCIGQVEIAALDCAGRIKTPALHLTIATEVCAQMIDQFALLQNKLMKTFVEFFRSTILVDNGVHYAGKCAGMDIKSLR